MKRDLTNAAMNRWEPTKAYREMLLPAVASYEDPDYVQGYLILFRAFAQG